MSFEAILPRCSQLHLITVIALVLVSCRSADFESAEKTIATYYKGYMTGDKSLTEKTLMGLGRIENAGFKPPIIENYRIIKSKEVSERSRFAEVGDVEITTEVRWKTGHPPEQFRFVLRKYINEWKIVSYSALPSEDYPPMP